MIIDSILASNNSNGASINEQHCSALLFSLYDDLQAKHSKSHFFHLMTNDLPFISKSQLN